MRIVSVMGWVWESQSFSFSIGFIHVADISRHMTGYSEATAIDKQTNGLSAVAGWV